MFFIAVRVLMLYFTPIVYVIPSISNTNQPDAKKQQKNRTRFFRQPCFQTMFVFRIAVRVLTVLEIHRLSNPVYSNGQTGYGWMIPAQLQKQPTN